MLVLSVALVEGAFAATHDPLPKGKADRGYGLADGQSEQPYALHLQDACLLCAVPSRTTRQQGQLKGRCHKDGEAEQIREDYAGAEDVKTAEARELAPSE